MLPKAVRSLAAELGKLPSIGPKTAERLALHLLRQSPAAITRLAKTLTALHQQVSICEECFNLAERQLCTVCSSQTRDRSLICVVENALDVEAIERTGSYNGLYHVLGGVLSPLEGITADQITVNELLARLEAGQFTELILALDHKMESDATIRHITKHLPQDSIRLSRLARGLPTGADIEYADSLTLQDALAGRKNLT